MSAAGSTLNKNLYHAVALALAGKIDAAEQFCLRAGATRAEQADSLCAVARACSQARLEDAATALYHKALAIWPNDTGSNIALADLALREQNYPKALVHIQSLIKTHPGSPDLLTALAQTYAAMGASEDATRAFRAARKVADLSPELLLDSARHAMACRSFEDAVESLQAVRVTMPTHVPTLNDLGVALLSLDRKNEAAECFRQIILLSPSEIPARLNLSSILMESARYEEAVQHLRVVRNLMPQAPSVRARLAHALALAGRNAEALLEADAGLSLDADSAELHHVKGVALRGLGRHDEALTHFQTALSRQPENGSLLLSMGNAQLEAGCLEAAEATFARLVEVAPTAGSHHRSYSQAHRYKADDPHIADMESRLAAPNIRETDAIELRFALGKAYDDSAQYAEAFGHYAAGNGLKRSTIEYDEADSQRLIDLMMGVRPNSVRARSGALSDRPVFIVGMPRSGTTLVEQILAAHPQVAGLGERAEWQNLLSAEKADMVENPTEQWLTDLGNVYLAATREASGDARRSVDKMPANFLYAGPIHLALPNARIIHLRRDPVDTCLSCYFHLFSERQDFTYDLAELGRYYRRYAALMDHWASVLPPQAMLEVRYESVVADLEGETRRILDFLGLDWDDACLQFHTAKSTVLTASAAEVRRPIYRTSIGRCSAYEEFLGPLIKEI